MALPLIRIVIPAYNEAANLPGLCARIRAALEPAEREYRLFVVDDGSRDSTADTVRSLASEHPLTLLSHGANRGIAAVFLTGLRAALEGAGADDPVVVMEGDQTSDPALLPRLLSALEPPCDVVIASRYLPGGAYRNFPFKRWLLSHGANRLLRLAVGLRGVSDYTIFYRAYRAGPLTRALAAYGDRFTSAGGFACNAEMLLRLSSFIGEIREVPFVYDYGLKRGASGMRIGGNLLSYAKLFAVYFGDREEP